MDRRLPNGRKPASRLLPVAIIVVTASCGCSSSSTADDGGADDACSVAQCDEICATVGACRGDCSRGTCRCNCAPDAGDADADRADVDGEYTEVWDDGRADDARVEADGDGACPYPSTGEERAGASAGVVCRRLSVSELERGLLRFSGDGDDVAAVGEAPGSAYHSRLWRYRRSSGCWEQLPEAVGAGGDDENVLDIAVENGRVAFSSMWQPTVDSRTCQLRLLDLAAPDLQVLDTSTSASPSSGGGAACSMRPIGFEYPWVVWRDIRQESTIFYPWSARAANLDTGELVNLSTDAGTGGYLWYSGAKVDLEGGWAVFDAGWALPAGPPPPDSWLEIVAVDLGTRTLQQLTAVSGEQFGPTVTEDWVAWVDLRNTDISYSSMLPCYAEIYGYNRTTREERALVTGAGALHGPHLDAEGPWLAYEDQRWDPVPDCDSDREQSIVALHLPTLTEIRITDWPGFESDPRVYDRHDGTFGVLFIQEISYSDAVYRLWDCDLPVPAG